MSVVSGSRGYIDFYTRPGYPGGALVAIILNELGLSYRLHENPYAHTKDASHPNSAVLLTDINTTGQKTSLDDPGTIAHYLITQYDRDHVISFPPDSPEAKQVSNWLSFFGNTPHEIVNSNDKETKRMKGSKTFESFFSLNQRLGEEEDYLVGHKFSLADIAQIPYVAAAEAADVDIEMFPFLVSWYNKVVSRQGVKKGLAVAGIRDA